MGDRDSLIILLTAFVYSINIPVLPGMLLEIFFFSLFWSWLSPDPIATQYLGLRIRIHMRHNLLSFDAAPIRISMAKKFDLEIPRLKIPTSFRKEKYLND